ncbi:putative hydrolase [metagenome]|uniref:Putative hydrolase n=1 Tax=metagenome TaxID=256318 RepID=A0A2P2C4V2_9ZZZZ
MIEIPTPDGLAEAYVARPEAPVEAVPGVLLFMDAIGLRPRIQDMADRIAGWGYVVLVPHLFHRLGRAADLAPSEDLRLPGAREAFFAEAMPRVGTLTAEVSERDIAAYLSALRDLPGVATSPVGVVGYCMGARLAVRAACAHPDEVAAAAGFHGGGLVTDDDDSPHRGLGSARAEFVFGHADHDRSMPQAAVDELGSALAAAGLSASNEVYAGAAHGYSMADTSMYDEAATERHFAELRGLFDRVL